MLVRMSWAPGWKVSGATSVLRAAPNFIVVVPTDKNVRIAMSRTTSEHVGNALSALGIVTLGALAVTDRRRQRQRQRNTPTDDPTDDATDDALASIAAVPSLDQRD